MYYVIRTYKAEQIGDDMFAGSRTECERFIANQPPLPAPFAYEIISAGEPPSTGKGLPPTR